QKGAEKEDMQEAGGKTHGSPRCSCLFTARAGTPTTSRGPGGVSDACRVGRRPRAGAAPDSVIKEVSSSSLRDRSACYSSSTQPLIGCALEELSFGGEEKDARHLAGGGQEHLDTLQILFPVLHLDELIHLQALLPRGEILVEGLPRRLRQVRGLDLVDDLGDVTFGRDPRGDVEVAV